MVKVKFPDGSSHEVEKGMKSIDLIKEKIGEGLARVALAVKINGILSDVTTPISEDSDFLVITSKDVEGQEILRHSAAHVLANAVLRLYPECKLTIGPSLEDSFYYDIDSPKPFTPEDLSKIELEMKKIIKEDIPFVKEIISKDEALELFKDNEFKSEMIKDLEGEITIYKNGEFFDLCRGPHVPSTSKVKAVKLTKVSGAFWRGDSKNKQLQRIYGVAFASKDELKSYLKFMEEAQKRDHRKIGKAMKLFSFHEEGPGLPFFLPKGMIIWDELTQYWKEIHSREDYELFKTPIMLNRTLWETSGHWQNYKDDMYTLKIDNQDFAIKPMNCPGGILIYNEDVHSYKDLPIRAGEIGLVHRHEASGALSGLFRVRAFHQDDAHIFMTEDQIESEILGVLSIVDEMYSTFGLDFHLELSTKPEKAIGSDEAWEISTSSLKSALEKTGREFVINEGDGAFYGPKIDIHIKDCLGRTWQCGTIQLDMNLPERFDMNYIAEDGSKKRPVMIHRVIYGAFERFFGIITEHFAGKFPVWLSPVQVKILPIADRHLDYCNSLSKEFKSLGIRSEVNSKVESTNKKIREAQLENVPLILVVGDKEIESNKLAVRTLDGKQKFGVDKDLFVKEISDTIKSRSLTLDLDFMK